MPRSSSKPPQNDVRSSKKYPVRIVVKFDDRVQLPQAEGAERLLEGELREGWARISERYPTATLRPLYGGEDAEALRKLTAMASENDPSYQAPNFPNYFVVQMSPGFEGESLAKMLSALPGVETAYVEGGPVDPPVTPTDDPRYTSQGYLQAAPGGIDAAYAWTKSGGDGFGVLLVDLERGWTLNHEDLSDAGITLISGKNQDFFGHGTSVLGEVRAVDNMRGGVGIAPRAQVRVVSQWRSDGSYNTAAAIASAAAVMSRGDVLLLEAQTAINGKTNMPVEAEQATYDAIRLAVAAGIVVVEAGGNGANDLDAYTDAAGHFILKYGHRDFRDSGAIMVGAASSSTPHRRLDFSNYGSRVDCYGWGENIDTTGDGWTGNNTTAYTGSFGGTSGASPIVAGAAVLVQALSAQYRGARYTPSGLRALLSDTRYNTASANPSSDQIGVMPDLRSIFDQVLNVPPWARIKIYRAILYILFGVTNDAPGVGIGPDGRPVPVGPWDPTMIRLAPEKWDMLTGLALTEMANGLEDEIARGEVQRAGLAVMQRSLGAIKSRM